jgi:hypothetical protein
MRCHKGDDRYLCPDASSTTLCFVFDFAFMTVFKSERSEPIKGLRFLLPLGFKSERSEPIKGLRFYDRF